MSFICHIHNYTEYDEEWNVFSAFNPSKCKYTWGSGQPTLRHPGSSWGFGALPKGLISVVDTSSQSRDSSPQPWVTSGFKSNALSIRPRPPPRSARRRHSQSTSQQKQELQCCLPNMKKCPSEAGVRIWRKHERKGKTCFLSLNQIKAWS